MISSRNAARLNPSDVTPVTYRGLEYHWHPAAFLSRQQAEYALQQFWNRCHVDSDCWRHTHRLAIPAATQADVHRLFDTADGQLPWVPLRPLAKPGSALDFDTDHLPCAIAVASDVDAGLANLHCDGRNEFPIDVIAFTFLMLTRWEEAKLSLKRDAHGRIAREALLASRQEFHQRPVVDEWALVVGSWLRDSGLDLHATLQQSARVLMTHDIDHPYRFATPGHIARHAAGELIRHSHNPIQAYREFQRGWRSWRTGTQDPYRRAIDWLMDLDEWLGLQGHFFFMSSDPSRFDEGYNLRQPRLQQMLREIELREHHIGWHPSYMTVRDPDLFARELSRFQHATGRTAVGGRQHYLRWDPQSSWDRWSASGLTFDCSVGFADCCGFRCGTSHPFPAYSHTQDHSLSLVEHPLHIMDCGLFQECRDATSATQKMYEILGRIRQVGGEAVTLIHNSFADSATIEAMVEPLQWLQSSQIPTDHRPPSQTQLPPWPALRRRAG